MIPVRSHRPPRRGAKRTMLDSAVAAGPVHVLGILAFNLRGFAFRVIELPR